jgi:DNA-binding PadR family transcriptional regulator
VSTIDLMLLGVVMKSPVSAYQLKKELEIRNIQKWIKISSPSIYKNFLRLHERGYVDGKIVREGEMPEKMMYSINEKGREYFMKLMNQYASDPEIVYIDFAVVISNLQDVDKETGLFLIEQMRTMLSAKRDSIKEQYEQNKNVSFYALSIIQLYEQMYSTFCTWTDQFEELYKAHSEK